jgi:GPH family glycoside/pentoside/hexuronide:cation symporter
MNQGPAPRLSSPVKAAYGFGLAAEGIKQSAFSVFLLFYYQQIVGLDPALCGLALFISLCIDAVADPAIGVWSDGLRSKLGRRHPLMYAGIVPLALAFLAVFMPPKGLSDALTFTWLLVFASIGRFAMALFVIPHQSLVPELTHDIGERMTLTSLRTVFAWIFGLLNSFMAYTVFLRGTAEHPVGLLNERGYPGLAVFGAVTMTISMLISALGTQRAAVAAQVSRDRVAEIPLRELPKAIAQAMKSPSYRSSLFAGLALFVGYGVTENISNYMNTFFWGFTSEQLGLFIFVIFGSSMVVMLTARALVQRLGNRKLGLIAAVMHVIPTPFFVIMSLLGLLPPPGDPGLFRMLIISVFINYTGLIMGMTVIGAMVADISDEHELTTGSRQEGLLFSAGMFMTKAASGVGTLAAGVLLRIAQFPENAQPSAVSPDLVTKLGAIAAGSTLFFGALMLYHFSRYTLDREAHGKIVDELTARRALVRY